MLGAYLRFIALGSYPTGFLRDEAFFGYNAYALFHTGKDITGNFLPLHLASFLFTPSGYAYASFPFIALFGLSEFSIRCASAFFGSATVLITFFLCRELFGFLKKKDVEILAWVSTFLLAISPWHINLSRSASAIAVVVFFVTGGVLLYLLAIKRKSWMVLTLAFFSWLVSLWFYIAPYSFLPFFIPLLFSIFRKEPFVKKTQWVQGWLFVLLILIPFFATFFSPQLSLRANSLNVAKSEHINIVVTEQIHADGTLPALVTRLIHNKLFFIAQTFTTNYFHHFSFDFLFTDSGFPDRYRVPLVGLLYLYELPLLLIGIATLFRWKRKEGYFLLGWILLAPVGSSLTTDDVPNLQRTLFMLPALTLIIGVGWVTLIDWVQGKQKPLITSILGLVMGLSVLFYIHQYYAHAGIYRPWYRQYGYKQLVAKVKNLEGAYPKVVVTNRESAPTIFFLFYLPYNPALFQKETAHTTMHDFDRIGFGKYTFSQEECPLQEKMSADGTIEVTGERHILYVNSGLCKVPKQARVLDTIYRSDNSKVFTILDLW